MSDAGSDESGRRRLYDWLPLSRGDRFPPGAVLAGTTRTDGIAYVGRFEGEAGKINQEAGNMWKFWANKAQSKKVAEVLVCHQGISGRWVPLNRGEPIPCGAVMSGRTDTDGVVYVGRCSGEPGKICVDYVDEEPRMNLFWAHHLKSSAVAEIFLVGDEPPASKTASLAVVNDPSPIFASYKRFTARVSCTSSGISEIMVGDSISWMWKDATILAAAKRNPLRWSPEQSVDATILDLAQVTQDDKHRPVLLKVKRGTSVIEKNFGGAAEAIAALQKVSARGKEQSVGRPSTWPAVDRAASHAHQSMGYSGSYAPRIIDRSDYLDPPPGDALVIDLLSERTKLPPERLSMCSTIRKMESAEEFVESSDDERAVAVESGRTSETPADMAAAVPREELDSSDAEEALETSVVPAPHAATTSDCKSDFTIENAHEHAGHKRVSLDLTAAREEEEQVIRHAGAPLQPAMTSSFLVFEDLAEHCDSP